MKRREVEIFSLSFLDVLTGALGAILFLFIVVPKGGGKAPAVEPQLNVTYDTINRKFFGEIPDSLMLTQAGDSLLALVVDFNKMPSLRDCPEPEPCPECPGNDGLKRKVASLEQELYNKSKVNASLQRRLHQTKSTVASLETAVEKKSEKIEQIRNQEGGDLPSVPCIFSIEINWEDIKDNVDLFACKDGACVYGARRKNPDIGFWDSGKSKTSIFGGDLRTTQEAVRQFDNIIPGEYNIYIQYKASEQPKPSLSIQGLIYTKTKESGTNSKRLNLEVPFNENERTLIGVLTLNQDGTFVFHQK